MVQFVGTGQPDRQSSPSRSGGYWKLHHPHRCTKSNLQEFFGQQGYRFPKSANKGRLINLHSRFQRDLPSYDGCTVGELQKLCAQRQLRIDPAASKKADLIHLLEAADENATFARFLELPSELRNIIYSIHIRAFRAVHRPTTPPITRVSKQLRQETLALFRSTCRTVIEVSGPHRKMPARINDTPRINARNNEAYFPIHLSWSILQTNAIFLKMPKKDLGTMSKVQLNGIVATSNKYVDASWDSDFNTGTISIRKSVAEIKAQNFQAETGLGEDFQRACEEQGERIKRALSVIVTREQGPKAAARRLQTGAERPTA